jgi:hypothetical protein
MTTQRLVYLGVSTLLGAVLLGAGRAAPPPVQVAAFCELGETPTFAAGFALLSGDLGEVMGTPIECENPDPSAQYRLQRTSMGEALYHLPTNRTFITNGQDIWAVTPDGLVQWPAAERSPLDGQVWSAVYEPADRIPLLPVERASFGPGFDARRYLRQGNHYNCSDFANQAQAQAVLRADPRDPNGLDRSATGVACATNPPPYDRVAVARPACTDQSTPAWRRSCVAAVAEH